MKSSILQKKIAAKEDVRRHESQLLADKKISPMELAQQNFCMKGIKLSDYRNSDGSFSLF